MTKFKVGDIVETFGARGLVVTINNSRDYPIGVTFDEGRFSSFTPDGRHHDWHKTPSLVLIERPKKTKKIKVWANVYSDPLAPTVVSIVVRASELSAITHCIKDGVTQQIEVKVLDDT